MCTRTFSGNRAEIGGEKNAEDYISNLVEICAEVYRVLKPSGSVFINLGDKMRARTRLQIPERVGIRLTDELGFCMRNKIIWDKGNSYCPEVTTRRFHNAWEAVLWLVKDASEYFFEPDQVRVPYDTDFVIDKRQPRHFQVDGGRGLISFAASFRANQSEELHR